MPLEKLTYQVRDTWSHLEEKDADVIDEVLRQSEFSYLSVDRTCLRDSLEAWVHVDIYLAPEELQGFSGRKAVLIWPNSD